MVNSAAQKQLLELAQLRLSQRNLTSPLTREEISGTVDQCLNFVPEWQGQVSREAIISQLQTMFSTFIGDESVLQDRDTYRPWLNLRRDSIQWRFWDRYRQLLGRKHLPPPVINALERVTDKILDRLGDPADSLPFNRRGMVVGDVQAGKTANYIGLICKAADAGYKVVIVLAGLHNNLRSQTQMRLDEGFVGKVSVPAGEALNTVGVGRLDSSLIVNWATNRTERGDFSRRARGNYGVHPGEAPLLFVVKKVRSVLESVLAWIDLTGNAQDQFGRRFAGLSLLMIDDEADNASIDTQVQTFDRGRPDPEHEPSAINALIRRILGRFDKAAYVGYTATPFANIFIHPDAETGSAFQDLFPKDFIVNIPPPDNYVGPSRVFGLSLGDDEEKALPGLPRLIHVIADHATSADLRETRGWMPPLHKSNHLPLFKGLDQVPPSLRRAIASFALVIAARRARGQVNAHNSMLVHVTRYQAVQRRVLQQVQECVDALKDEIRQGTQALESWRMLWNSSFVDVASDLNFPDCPPVQWTDLVSALRNTIDMIQVREINGHSADVLDYDEYRDTGLNVIAIGGDKLARGLTLEGLSISYFLRGSRMYDSLLQMGRWFGYRPGYLDLCRLFTTADLVEWYEHITLASEELRREFDRMETIRATPRDFGLRVRSHPTLAVTSRVKMRHGTEMQISYAGSVSETTIFSTEPRILESNLDAANELLTRLGNRFLHTDGVEQQRPGDRPHRWDRSHFWKRVPANFILDFLDGFRTHEDAPRANSQVLAKYIRRQNSLDELTDWNVLLVGGDGVETVQIGSVEVPAVVRQPKTGYYRTPDNRALFTIHAGEPHRIRRLLNPRDEGVDISAPGYEAAMRQTIDNPPKRRRADDGSPPTEPAAVYLRQQRPPSIGLMLLYPLAREARLNENGSSIQHRFLDIPFHILGLGISFPESDRAKAVSYYVNAVYSLEEDDET